MHNIENLSSEVEEPGIAVYIGKAFGRYIECYARTDVQARLWSLMHIGGVKMHRGPEVEHLYGVREVNVMAEDDKPCPGVDWECALLKAWCWCRQ